MSLWSPQQREWLLALGLPVLVLAGDEGAPPRIDEVSEPKRNSIDAARSEVAPVVAKPPRPLPIAPPEPAVASVSSSSRSPSDRLLHRALLRATGQRTTRAAEEALAGLGVDIAALRDDAAGKRALWARLRALRRGASRP